MLSTQCSYVHAIKLRVSYRFSKAKRSMLVVIEQNSVAQLVGL